MAGRLERSPARTRDGAGIAAQQPDKLGTGRRREERRRDGFARYGAGLVVGSVAGVLVRRECLEEDKRQHERDEDAHRGQQIGERHALGGVLALGSYAFGEQAMRQQPECTRQHHKTDDPCRHIATLPSTCRAALVPRGAARSP